MLTRKAASEEKGITNPGTELGLCKLRSSVLKWAGLLNCKFRRSSTFSEVRKGISQTPEGDLESGDVASEL